MDWLLLAALGIMWVAFLLPSSAATLAVDRSVEDFERRMESWRHAEVNGAAGRWIITPRKGMSLRRRRANASKARAARAPPARLRLPAREHRHHRS